MEEWKAVEAKGISWLVSSDGRVKNPARKCTYKRVRLGVEKTIEVSFEEREIAPYPSRNGYLEVASMQNGKRIKMLLHRLVGMAFVPGYVPELTINHINGRKTDNRVENLEWVSLAKNTQHEWETGLVDLRGEGQPGSKLTTKRVVYIRKLLAQGISAHTLAIVAGVSQSTIALIRDGKRWAHVAE